MITVEQAGDAAYTALKVAQQSLDTNRVVIEGDFRTTFLYGLQAAAVYVAEEDGRLSSREEIAIRQIFWLDPVDPKEISSSLSDNPDAAENAITYLKAMAATVQRAERALQRLSAGAPNPFVESVDIVFRAMLDVNVVGRATEDRYAALMAQLTEAGALPPEELAADEVLSLRPDAAILQCDEPGAQTPLPTVKHFTPIASCPARLRDGESCYAVSPATLFQESNVTRRVRYAGISARARIVSGISYRAGSYNVDRTRAPKIERIAQGTLCVTDQRLIFLSNVKNLDLPYAKLLSCETEPGLIEVTRSNAGRLIFEDVEPYGVECFEQQSGTSADHRLAVDYGRERWTRERPRRLLSRGIAFLMAAGLVVLAICR